MKFTKFVNICGIPHKIYFQKDSFNTDMCLGDIQYDKAVIRINDESAPDIKREALCHEIAHGILIHIGRADLSNDETFVTALGNALNQSFNPAIYSEKTEEITDEDRADS